MDGHQELLIKRQLLKFGSENGSFSKYSDRNQKSRPKVLSNLVLSFNIVGLK